MSDNLIERPLIPLPDGFTWGFVTARSIHAMADTTQDWDRYPEARGSNGRVIFTPRVRFNKHTEDPTAFVQYEIARARIREGTMVDAEGLEGIWLITGDYDVTFQIDDGSIPGFPITVTEEYTEENPLDLVKYSPIETPPGYVEIVRIVDRERAESAAEAAEGHAETASGYVDEARQLVQTETFEGFVSDAQSARDQADQHRVSAEESANSASQDANRSEMAYAGVEDLLEDLPDTFEDVATRDYVDTSVSGLASESYVDDRTTEVSTIKGAIPEGTDVDDAFGEEWHGCWYVTTSAGVTGLPKDPVQGSVFEVQWTTGANGTTQFYTDVSDRYWREASLSAGGNSRVTSWGSWRRIASTAEVESAVSGLASESYVDSEVSNLQDSVIVVTPNLSQGDDLDDFLGNQLSYVGSGTTSSSIVNRPPDSPSSGATVIVYTGGAGTQNQEWTLNTGSRRGHKWVRSRTANSDGWGSWHKLVLEEDLDGLSTQSWVTSQINSAVSGLQSTVESMIDDALFGVMRGRGEVEEQTDLDDMYGFAWAGVWFIRGSSSVINSPITFSSQATMVVYSSGLNAAVVQTVTTDLTSVRRESLGTGRWGPWHSVTGDTL